MNKAQLTDAVAQKAGISKVDAKRSIDALLTTVAESLRSGEKVTLTGFGSFVVTRQPARTGRNFKTGAPVDIPAKTVVKFRSGMNGNL